MWRALVLLAAARLLWGQDGSNVLVIVNDASLVSRRIGEYYVRKRGIPPANFCRIKVDPAEDIDRDLYEKLIEEPVARHLRANNLDQRVLYLATTLGVPLRIRGAGDRFQNTGAAVDSELTLLYAKMNGSKPALAGMLRNPFYGKKNAVFQHPDFPIYLVTRLAGYDFEDVKGIVDRSLEAVNRGKFVIDLNSGEDRTGNNWLRAAAKELPAARVVLDETAAPLYDQTDVIGYASWGSNDKNRKRRFAGFQWLPGAVATEFVSSNGRTFRKPPAGWTITNWENPAGFFANSPQSLTADYIHEGATGCSGHVAEPYLGATPRPEILLPAYFSGRNLAESYWMSIPGLSWQNIVVGDPLCRLKKVGN
jgi:uncharacterized protein (TIGR03790 family)